jgi:histidinol phosphatase-like PHP family hydrolase
MIDLHTHTIFSDGALIPAELARRAEIKGYTVLGLTDHVDASNLEFVVTRLAAAARDLDREGLRVLPGVELTHVRPEAMASLAARARNLGALYVVVHGESPVEPVAPGTNRAAIDAGVEILAHPGLITEEEARLAAAKGVLLEITTRRGHSLTNGHVARMARMAGAKLVVDTDTHQPGDLVDDGFARVVVQGAGLDKADFDVLQASALGLVRRLVSPVMRT